MIHFSTTPAAQSNDARPSLSWAQNFVAKSVTCTLDGHALTPCKSGDDLPALKNGDHSFKVTAVPPAGGSVTASTRWLTDLVDPTVPNVTGTPNGWTNTSVTVNASSSDDPIGPGGAPASGLRGYEHRVGDGSTWGSVTPGAAATVAAAGQTWIEFRSIDKSGNRSVWSNAGSGGTEVQIDLASPTLAPSGGSASWGSNSITVSANAADDQSGLASVMYQTRTGAGDWSAPKPGASVTVADSGTTQVMFQATDNAGNQSSWTIADSESTAEVDTTAPTLAPSGGADTWTHGPTTIRANATDTDSGLAAVQYETSIGGGGWSDPITGDAATISAEGHTRVRFQATDNVGNQSDWTTPDAASTANIDTTAPTMAPSGGSTSFGATPVTITANATDPGSDIGASSGLAGVEYETSADAGANWSDPTAGDSTTISTSGTTEVRFRATDNAGNQSDWTTPGQASSAEIQSQLDIQLIVDRTGSMSDDQKMANLRTALLRGFLPGLSPTLDNVGLTVFPPDTNGTADVCRSASATAYDSPHPTYTVAPLANLFMDGTGALVTTSPLVSDITCLQPGGDTAYVDALNAANAELQADGRPGVQKVIILLSDGAANTGANCRDVVTTTGTGTSKKTVTTKSTDPKCIQPCQSAINAAATYKQAGVMVYTILYGNQSDQLYCEDYDGSNEQPKITPQTAMNAIATPGDYYVDTVPTLLPAVFQSIFADATASAANQP